APFGRVRFYSSDGTTTGSGDDIGAAFDIVPTLARPTSAWANYSGTVSAANFVVFAPSATTLSQVLSNVIRIEITAEAISGVNAEVVGFDNVRFAPAVAVPEAGSLALLLPALALVSAVVVRRRK
ncbi:MAG: hypothetical protein H7Y38_18490, partial [Armatimonadetes bacterium]|nr:hypothetical protein [Armatimonadota bacterium]